MNTGLVFGMSLLMMAVGIAFLYMLFKGKGEGGPKSQIEWAGTVLSGLLVVSALGLMILASGSSPEQQLTAQQPAVAIEDFTMEVPANDFSFTGVHDNVEHRLSDYQGKVVLLNFWATWCAPCRAEIPDLNRLQGRYGEDGFVVISISDEEKELLTAFEKALPMKTLRMMMPELSVLPSPFTRSFDVRPVTFIIDRAGTVRRCLLGARSYDFFQRAISPFL